MCGWMDGWVSIDRSIRMDQTKPTNPTKQPKPFIFDPPCLLLAYLAHLLEQVPDVPVPQQPLHHGALLSVAEVARHLSCQVSGLLGLSAC